MTFDEYIDWLLSSNQDPILQSVARNILDEPIPEATKERLLKPLLPLHPKPIPAPRKRKLEKRQTVLREFDPLHDKTKAKLWVKRSQLLSLVTDCGRRGHSQKHYKRSRLHDRKFVFANRVVNNFLYLRFVLIVPSVLRHWWC